MTEHEVECGPDSGTQKFRRILAAVDGSECSAHALRAAIRLAKSEDAELTILHVMVISFALYSGDVVGPLAKMEEKAKHDGELFLAKAESVAKDAGIQPKLAIAKSVDSAARGITDYALRNDNDLIVVGTRGLGGLKRLLLGSVAAGVVHCAHCPVMVVR